MDIKARSVGTPGNYIGVCTQTALLSRMPGMYTRLYDTVCIDTFTFLTTLLYYGIFYVFCILCPRCN